MITVNGYTAKEIMDRSGVTRDAVSKWAKEYKWASTKIGNTNVYSAFDVDAFFTARLRRDIMQKARWTTSAKLIWLYTWDVDCPECPAFAVKRPVKPGEEQTGEAEIYCENCGLIPPKGGLFYHR